MHEEREEREQYMDSLEQQMEEQREQIQRTLEQMTQDSDRRWKALENFRALFPASPASAPCEALRSARLPRSRSEVIHPQAVRKVPGNPPLHGPGGSARRLLERKANQ